MAKYWNLRDLRRSLTVEIDGKKHKMTQQQLADYVGVTQGMIGAYEAGIRRPNIDTAKKLQKFFKVRGLEYTLEDIYRGTKPTDGS